MSFPPQAFLVGAAKAGTTMLADLLDQHPRIVLSSPKEPEYFGRHYDRGIDWYRSCFDDADDAILLDATTAVTGGPVPGTPGYTEARADDPRVASAARIAGLCPNARLIYILRDPVTQVYSLYWHAVRAGNEDAPFRRAIAEDPSYLSCADYAAQLERLRAHFPRENLLLLVFEEVRRDWSATARRCAAFVGADAEDFGPQVSDARNRSYRLSGAGRLVHALVPSRDLQERLTHFARAAVPDALHPLMYKVMTRELPPMSEEDRAYLAGYFRDRNRRLAEMTGLDLSHWTQ